MDQNNNGITVAVKNYIVRWLAFIYIVVVLVISAKARASSCDLNVKFNFIDHQISSFQ